MILHKNAEEFEELIENFFFGKYVEK